MTYCVGIRLDAGLVFLSDSRTNAGLDAISTFRKMIVYEKPGDRFMVMLSAGNLSISQSVREILQVEKVDQGPGLEPLTMWNATSMFDAARVLGSAMRRVHAQDGPAMKAAGIIVYTVGFDLAGDPNAQALMAGCATDAAHAYLATTGADLTAAFQEIGQNIASLRVAR